MKKLVSCTTTICLYFLLSCNNANDNKANTTSNTTTTSEQEKYIDNNERVYRALETGNFNGIDSLWADNIVDHMPKGDVKGKDSVKASLMEMHNQMKDFKIETIASGYDSAKGYLITLYRATGTTKGAMPGMPANTKFDMKGVDVVKIVNGKAVEHWEYDDPKDMMKK
jgi:predicted SnoaL-like aldol condensation-catalyzing enzyme